MKNKVLKKLAVIATVATMAISMVGCGKSAEISKTYSTISSQYIDGIGWYQTEVCNLQLNKDGSYELNYITDRFGAEDCDMRGLRSIVFKGTYTSAPSTDGEPSHLDITLKAATQITWDQQGKGFTRVETLPGNFFLNTAEWTDAMTTACENAGTAMNAQDLLSTFAKDFVLTVEEPSLDPEDTTLSHRIIGNQNFGIENGQG